MKPMTKLYNGKTVEELHRIYSEAYTAQLPWNGHEAGIQAVAEACSPAWIAVEERLPQDGLNVLCCGNKIGFPVWVSVRRYLATHQNPWYISLEEKVTHWQPLPQPPQQGNV